MNQWKELNDAEVLRVADQLARRTEGTHDEPTLRVALMNELSRRELANQFDFRRLKVVLKPEYQATLVRYEGKPRVIFLSSGLSRIALGAAKSAPMQKIVDLKEFLHFKKGTGEFLNNASSSGTISTRGIIGSVFNDTPRTVTHLHLNAFGLSEHTRILKDVYGVLNQELPKRPSLEFCIIHGFSEMDAQRAIQEQKLKIERGANLPNSVFIE